MRHETRLVLAVRAYASIERECLSWPMAETGGVLVGRELDGDLVVPFVVGAGPAARRSRSGFAPDCSWQQGYLDFLFNRFGLDYVGDFHRHPGSFDRPSEHDRRTAERIVTDPAWRKSKAVFPIAVIDQGRVRMRAYLMSRDSLKFSELPLELASDSDARMRQVLLGWPNQEPDEERCDDRTYQIARRRGGASAGPCLRRLLAGLRARARGRSAAAAALPQAGR